MLSNKTLPNWLYEPLPLIYTAAGMFVMLGMDSTWGMFSGLMLLSAGILIWKTRRAYRNAHRRNLRATMVAKSKPEPARKVKTDTRSKPMLLTWNPAYECGYPIIDSQHRHLFELTNNLLNGILSEQEKIDVELLLDDLLAALSRHCESEDLFLLKIQHPDANTHQEHHRSLLENCRELAERYHAGQVSAHEVFKLIGSDLILGHILNEDIRCLARPG